MDPLNNERTEKGKKRAIKKGPLKRYHQRAFYRRVFLFPVLFPLQPQDEADKSLNSVVHVTKSG